MAYSYAYGSTYSTTITSSTTSDNWIWANNNTFTVNSGTDVSNWVYSSNSITYSGNRIEWYGQPPGMVYYNLVGETPEQTAAREERKRLEAERLALAEQTAEQLLMDHLDDVELGRWVDSKEIHVRSQHGRRYCIVGRKRAHNIFELNERGERVKELCVFAGHEVPDADNVLAQMLCLRYAEDHLLAKANVWSIVEGARLARLTPDEIAAAAAVDARHDRQLADLAA